jgi:transcription-repair coupling factor (superfamily II helicase)
LEMRGAGTLMGEDQTGKSSEVGLETYSQMLTDAISALGGIQIQKQPDVDIQIPVDSFIPESYVTNAKERLRVYRRFFGTRSEEALHSLISECEDRFGPPPQPVKNLSEIARIRRLLVTINAKSLKVGPEATELRLPKDVLQGQGSEDSERLFRRILDVCNRTNSGVRLTPDGRLLLPLKQRQLQGSSTQQGFQDLRRLLGLLAGEMNAEKDTLQQPKR